MTNSNLIWLILMVMVVPGGAFGIAKMLDCIPSWAEPPKPGWFAIHISVALATLVLALAYAYIGIALRDLGQSLPAGFFGVLALWVCWDIWRIARNG